MVEKSAKRRKKTLDIIESRNSTLRKHTMNKPFRILSLSGGGIRGIFQATFLSKISKELPLPLWSNFDLICGTSTGAIVGMAVAMGIDTDRIVDLYRDKGDKIFRKTLLGGMQKGPLYDQNSLKVELVRVFGNKQLKDAKTKILISSVSINRYDHKVFANFPTLTKSDEGLSAVEVVLASAAAPTYFLPVTPTGQERSYVDGGLWANTPSSLGILFANKYLGIPLNNIRLVSVGTGDFPTGAPIEYFANLRQFSLDAIKTIFELMFASQSSFADQYSKEILGEDNYLRVSAVLDQVISLDDVVSAISKLPPLAEAAAEINLAKAQRMLMYEETRDEYIQRPDRDKLVSDLMIYETGLSAFYPSREHYKLREDAKSIDIYVNTAKNSLIMVSISLIKGISFENLRSVLERKLEDRNCHFEATISLLNPNKDYLMASLAPIFEKNQDDIRKDIVDGLTRLTEFRDKLSISARNKFHINLHNAIPFGSAIIIDHDMPYGKIQIETKAYKAPYGKSFAFEVVPVKKDGFYITLLNGFLSLIKDGEMVK